MIIIEKKAVSHNKMHMGGLYTSCFNPKRPSSDDTYIKITEKSYWVVIGLYTWKLQNVPGINLFLRNKKQIQ